MISKIWDIILFNLKSKKEDYETFAFFIQGYNVKGTLIKIYQEIVVDVYSDALLSLDSILYL